MIDADRIDALATAAAATWPLIAVGLGFLLLLLGGLLLPDLGTRALPEPLIRPEPLTSPETDAARARLHADADRAAELRKAADR